jgi:hypothetical protein
MHNINIFERRRFTYLDFKNFEIGGRIYFIPHGTFRNKISKFLRSGLVELYYNSKIAFYKLKDVTFGYAKSMTRNHMGISSVIPVTGVIPYTAVSEAETFLGYLRTLDTNTNSIHDIHTKFTVPDIYIIMSLNPKYSKLINPVSKDIPLEVENVDDTYTYSYT